MTKSIRLSKITALASPQDDLSDNSACNKCGLCCTVELLDCNQYDEQLVRMRENYIKTITYNNNRIMAMRSVCSYLREGGKCAIYTKRPLVCRGFPRHIEDLWLLVNPECGMCQSKTQSTSSE